MPSGRRLIQQLAPLIVAASLGSGLSAWALGRTGPGPVPSGSLESYGRARAGAISAQIEQAGRDYILLAGDSHIERLYLPSLCGLPTVNAGIGGATAPIFAESLSRIRVGVRPRATILTIGTNDTFVRRASGSPESVRAFRDTTRRLVSRLATISAKLYVTAIPPVDASQGSVFPPEVASLYSAILKEHCDAGLCVFVDPFRERTGLRFSDGVHLAGSNGIYAGLSGTICPNLRDRTAAAKN
jgi:hypothetical protein